MWIVDGAAELATVVAPQDGVVLDDSELVNLSPDGGLMLEDKNGMSVGLSVQGATTKPEIVDGAAVETGVDTDLDVVSRATSDGAQILAVLGSKDASNEIGFDLDEVAYIRFASEYYKFRNVEDIMQQLEALSGRIKDVKEQQKLF